MNYILVLSLCLFTLHLASEAQKFTIINVQKMFQTSEDTRLMGSGTRKTVISGYGPAAFQRNFNQQQYTVALESAVLIVGHRSHRKFLFPN